MRGRHGYAVNAEGKRILVPLTRWMYVRPPAPRVYRVKYKHTGPGRFSGCFWRGYAYWDGEKWHKPWSNPVGAMNNVGLKPWSPVLCWRDVAMEGV